MNRRGFITAAAGFLAAPMLVRASSLDALPRGVSLYADTIYPPTIKFYVQILDAANLISREIPMLSDMNEYNEISDLPPGIYNARIYADYGSGPKVARSTLIPVHINPGDTLHIKP